MISELVKRPHLEVYDINKNILAVLSDKTPFTARDLRITHSINETSSVGLNMSCRNEKYKYLTNENLIKFEGEYYSIKKSNVDDASRNLVIECEHESCSLKDKLSGKIEKISETAGDLITLVLAGTGWVFGVTDIPNTKKRHLITNELSVFGNLVEIATNFNARLKFSTNIVNGVEIKSVSLYANPIDNGRYVKRGRDLKSVNISYDSTNLTTRLYVYGKNDDTTGNEISMMSANPTSLPYVDNFSYFKDLGYTDSQIQANKDKFVKELTIRNNQLYTPKAVYDFAVEEVARLCYPKIEAEVNIMDLSVLPEYLLKPIEMGETVWVFNKDINLILKAEIVSIDKSYDNPLDITIGISNIIEKNSILKNMVETSNTVDKITDATTNKIHGMYIKDATIGSAQIGTAVIDDAHIKKLSATTIDVETINGKNANLQNIMTNFIKGENGEFINLTAENVKIDNAVIKDANIEDLTAEKIKVNLLEGNTAILQNILANFISGNSGEFIHLTGSNAIFANAIIKDAMIDTVNASKMRAGTLDTNLVNILSENGNLSIKDNTIQIKDANKTVRVQIGKDGNNDYSIYVWDSSGNIMFTPNGLTENGIKSGIIRNDMISDGANIAGDKLNIGSVIESINNDNTTTLKSSKVLLDTEGQSLEVAFNTLKTTTNKIESQKMYRVVVESTDGILFKNDNIQTTLKAHVFSWDTEVTNEIPSSCFTWIRKSKDVAADEYWNSQHGRGVKQIAINSGDVTDKAVFSCEVDI